MTNTAMQDRASAVLGRPPFAINRSEALWWAYLRISGVTLIFLVLGHLLIQHILNDVHQLSAEWVIQQRWAFAGWRVYDALLLAIGYTHGLRGVWQVMQDYVHHPTALAVIKWALIAGGGLILLVGAVAIVAAPWTM
jgi:succinate dehydrogenase / fumarate reductase membrane anchor subunit